MTELKFPKHVEMELTHNEHKGLHRSLDYHLEQSPLLKFKDEDNKKEALLQNELWTLQWYPKTSITFFLIGASSLEKLLEFASEIEKS